MISRSLSSLVRRGTVLRTIMPVAITTVKPFTRLSTASLVRFNSTNSSPNDKTTQIKVDKPELMLAFKCKKCDTRSSHIISKQAYTGGTVLVTCPGCQNRHLIADHLKIFSDDRITIQDILNAKGESVSQSTDDLVFDEIPQRLKELIGHHAKDAPSKSKESTIDEEAKYLPEKD